MRNSSYHADLLCRPPLDAGGMEVLASQSRAFLQRTHERLLQITSTRIPIIRNFLKKSGTRGRAGQRREDLHSVGRAVPRIAGGRIHDGRSQGAWGNTVQKNLFLGFQNEAVHESAILREISFSGGLFEEGRMWVKMQQLSTPCQARRNFEFAMRAAGLPIEDEQARTRSSPLASV